ncbi:transcriptional regulator [Betalipothrixvirus pezzuloense]|uniref:Uncharacterized protein n=1 Tax=Betalipothrixvirus pezzuloense TaxID=346883 RepID=A7WKM1_9VIRU|nr:transcriptional regulator [Acidianus filamentous virus 7]CAJ31621.1 conserved hypothetical protein [Acidianus filamentous virus 7]
MIKHVIIGTNDDAKKTKEGKFLLALVKLIGKEEISFTETTIISRDITKNEEMKEIINDIISFYKKKVPELVKFKKGKVTIEGKIVLMWEYENENKD